MSNTDSNDDRHPVEIIAEEYSARMRAGERPTIEEYAIRYPEHADLIRSVLPSIALVERVSRNDTENRKTPVTGQPEALGDYEIVREIGRGGMGVVYEAIQRSLNRHVALKVISNLISGNTKHNARFRREAEAAACLHHTNIVPIYGIGEDNGLQYYAMQLIDGVTLHDVIECLRNNTLGSTHSGEAARWMLNKSSTDTVSLSSSTSSRTNAATLSSSLLNSQQRQAETAELAVAIAKETPDATTPISQTEMIRAASTTMESSSAALSAASQQLTRQYFRNVATTIANVANALHYAHHQRVLHRDIKPANLLLDREGTVWITDFGLACRTDLDAETQTGEILGTLRYMAPEQIAGTGDSRVDIYSLGLTLFELLTLKPAIESPKSRMLDPERNSVIRNPRSIQPNIPPDLQTITLKACAFAPKDRYQHAREFEEDLRRFLEDRPILAKRSTRVEMLIRWARRNPAIASLTTATLALLVLIASLLGIWNRQQQRAIREIGKQFERAETNLAAKTEALTQVELEQSRAEKNLNLALKAFDQITNNIASRGSTLSVSSDLDDDEFGEFAGATLSQADVALLESLLEFFNKFSEENAKDLRIEAAVGRQRVADIQHRLGQLEQADLSYQKALDSFRSILKQKPDQAEVVLPVLAIHAERLTLYAKRGQLANALGELADARLLLKQSPEVSASADGRFALARLLNCIGTIGTRFGNDSRPRINRPPFGRFLPQGEPLLPDQIARINREAEFNAEALALLKELTNESPDNVSYQVVLGRSLRDEARIARMLKDMPRADSANRRSIEIFESLCKTHPDSAAFKYELADTLSKTGDQQRCSRALAICEEISKENPQIPEYRTLKATILIKLGMMAGRTGRGEELLNEAIVIQRELADRYADVGAYNMTLSQSLKRLSELQDALGQSDKAKETLKESNEIADREKARMKNTNKPQRPFIPFFENLRDRQPTEKRTKESK